MEHDDEDPSWGYEPDQDQTISVDWWKVATFLVFVVLIAFYLCGCVTHRPRYDKYDRNGLLKGSTPLYLDKSNGRKTKPHNP